MTAFEKLDKAIDILKTGDIEASDALTKEAFAEIDAEAAEQNRQFEERQKKLDEKLSASAEQFENRLKAIEDWKQSEMKKINRDEQRLKRKYGHLWPNF